MSEPKTGLAVVEQANDDSIWNAEPAAVRGVVTGVLSAGTTIAVVFGVMTEAQREPIIHAVGETAFWAFTALTFSVPVAQSLWTRFGVWSGRTTARVAVANAGTGRNATLDVP